MGYESKFYINEYIKYREYYNAMLQWTLLYQKNRTLSEYLYNIGYEKIAIYGMSDMGNCLAGDLIGSKYCKCLYAIDQGNAKLFYDIKCYKLTELPKLAKPDLVVVTVPHAYDQIKMEISRMGCFNIISITELVYNAYYEIGMG